MGERMRLQRIVGILAILFSFAGAQAAHAAAYRNFRAAIYIPVNGTKRLADPAAFEREFARVSSQLKFDKVYIEAYRNREFATDAELDAVKRALQAKGIQTSGGITLAAGGWPGGSSAPSITRISETAPNASAPCGSSRATSTK